MSINLIYLTLLLTLFHSVISRKGMTWKAVEWPDQGIMVGKWGCSGCDPYKGDTECTERLPILCITGYKTLPRPYYPVVANGGMPDKGFYNGWSGGVIAPTNKRYQGLQLTSWSKGNSFCRN